MSEDFINKVIEQNDAEPLVAEGYSPFKTNRSLSFEIVALVASVNEGLLPERKVSLDAAAEVARRSLDRTRDRFPFPNWRMDVAMREVNDFVNASAYGKPFKLVDNSDLLYANNPLSSVVASAEFDKDDLEFARAEWLAADARIVEKYRPLVASAFLAAKDSVDEKFAVAILNSVDANSVPKDVVLSILNK